MANVFETYKAEQQGTGNVFEQYKNKPEDAPHNQTVASSEGKEFFTGIKRGLAKTAGGIGQRLGLVSQQDMDAALRAMAEEKRNEGISGSVGEFVGDVAPTFLLPGGGAKTIAGNLLKLGGIGGVIGASQPTATGDSVLKNTATGAGLGALTGGLFQTPKIISKLLPKTAEQRLMQSALKLPTPLKQSVKDDIAETMIADKIPVSNGGLKKVRTSVDTINREIDDVIGAAPNQQVSRDAVITRIDDLKTKYQNTKALPEESVGEAQKVIDEFSLRPDSIPAQQAQEFKKDIYRDLKGFYEKYQKSGVVKPEAWGEARATMAKGLREELDNLFPELKNLNAKDAELIKVNQSLEKAMGRINNLNLLRLVPAIMSGSTSFGKYLGALMIDHPYVKSQLAFAIRKARTSNMGGKPSTGLAKITAEESTQPPTKEDLIRQIKGY